MTDLMAIYGSFPMKGNTKEGAESAYPDGDSGRKQTLRSITYAAIHHQAETLACASQPCANGGLCENGSGQEYTCHCAAMFNGPNCEGRNSRPTHS